MAIIFSKELSMALIEFLVIVLLLGPVLGAVVIQILNARKDK